MYKELVEKQNKLIELFSYNLTHPELLVKPYPFQEITDEINGLYKEYKKEKLMEQTDEVEDLQEKIEILKTQLSKYQNDEWEYSTRQDFLEIFERWLMDEDEETDDVVSFSQTPRQLVLKIKSVIDEGCLTMTFTKEHGEQEGDTNETV